MKLIEALEAGRQLGPGVGSPGDACVISLESPVFDPRLSIRRSGAQRFKLVLERFAAEQIQLLFAPTERNSPLQEFLSSLLESPPDGPVTISRARFFERCPGLYHAREPEGAGGRAGPPAVQTPG